MLLETRTGDWQILRGTNCTDNGFPTRVGRLGKPSGLGSSAAQATSNAVIDLVGSSLNGLYVQNGLLLLPYGEGSDGNTFSLRVIGWRRVVSRQTDRAQTIEALELWIPTVLCELLCTVSSTNVGIAGGILTASELFAKTIAVTYGNANVSVEAVSPATAGLFAHAVVDIKGWPVIEITGTTGASVTNFNTLYTLN